MESSSDPFHSSVVSGIITMVEGDGSEVHDFPFLTKKKKETLEKEPKEKDAKK